MKFKKMKTSLFALAAASSFFMPITTKANEIEQSEKPILQSGGFIQGLQSVDLNKKAIEDKISVQEGFVNVDGKTYYYSEFGQRAKGRTEINGGTYYFNENGEMQTGFVKEDRKTFYYGEDGKLAKGTVTDNSKTYTLQNDGSLLTGWVEKDGTKSYYSDNGTKVKNTTQVIDGARYSFDQNGNMEVNVSRDIYDFGADGIGKPGKAAYQKIADAALAQVGVFQDCTMLVTNALKAVGIDFHGWPEEYLSLGPATSDPVPGDIVVYQGHVALYIGDGKAVHGGWNGNETVVWSVDCASPFIAYVHPQLPL